MGSKNLSPAAGAYRQRPARRHRRLARLPPRRCRPGRSDTPPDSESNEASQPGQQGPAAPGSAGSGAKSKPSPAARRVLPTAVLFKTSSGTGSGLAPRESRPVHSVSRIELRGGWPRRGPPAYAYRTGNARHAARART